MNLEKMAIDQPAQSGTVGDNEEGVFKFWLNFYSFLQTKLKIFTEKTNEPMDGREKAMSLGKAKMVYKMKGKQVLEQIR